MLFLNIIILFLNNVKPTTTTTTFDITETHNKPTHIYYFNQAPYAYSAQNGEWNGIIKAMLSKGLLTVCNKSFRLTDNVTAIETNSNIVNIITETDVTRLAQILNINTSLTDDDIILVGPTTYDRFNTISPLFQKLHLTKSRPVLVMSKGKVLLLPKFLGTFGNSLTVIVFAILCAILVAAVVWSVETIFGTGHFPSSPGSGIWSSFWFIIVTMTTVGYGDKTPKHPLSRVIVMAWLIFGLMLVALITSSAWNAMNNEVNVRSRNVAVLENSTEQSIVIKRLLANPIPFNDYQSIMNAVETNETIAAALFDKRIAGDFLPPKEKIGKIVIEREIKRDTDVYMYAYYNNVALGCRPSEIGAIGKANVEEEKIRLVDENTKPIQIDSYVLRYVHEIFDGTDNGLLMYMTTAAVAIVLFSAIGELVYRRRGKGSWFGCGDDEKKEEEKRWKRYKELEKHIQRFVDKEVECLVKRTPVDTDDNKNNNNNNNNKTV